jgi:hypothetical protein
MSSIVTDHVEFGELLLVEANRELDASQYEEAAYSARLAKECFEAILDDPECMERSKRGVEEARRITEASYRSGDAGATRIQELVDRRFVILNHEADELAFDSGVAVRAALAEQSACGEKRGRKY